MMVDVSTQEVPDIRSDCQCRLLNGEVGGLEKIRLFGGYLSKIYGNFLYMRGYRPIASLTHGSLKPKRSRAHIAQQLGETF